MCGIAGAFRTDGSGAPPLSRETLKRMTDQIRYRGPDEPHKATDP